MKSTTETFNLRRPFLMGLAYRMLGSVAEAEDILQDAWLRWQAADRSQIAAPKAFLTRVVTRLCLDHAKSARARREVYTGPWLPEPSADLACASASPHADPEAAMELANDLSMALLLVLERLSPLERAAFLLHDVFDLPFGEIAQLLESTPEACRKLASRAREHVRAEKPAREVPAEAAARFFDGFYRAMQAGDISGLAAMLAEDAVLIADGGGKKIAALAPIAGREKIIRFFAGLADKFGLPGPERLFRTPLNGGDGLIVEEPDGSIQAWCLDWTPDGRIAAIYLLRNPDKLARLEKRIHKPPV